MANRNQRFLTQIGKIEFIQHSCYDSKSIYHAFCKYYRKIVLSFAPKNGPENRHKVRPFIDNNDWVKSWIRAERNGDRIQ